MPTPEDDLRFISARRNQVEMMTRDLESLLPAEHEARSVWAFVERMDLWDFYRTIKAKDGEAGRPATDPKVLVALWMYATLKGIGSARELTRLTESHDAYRWLRGGVPLNHHMLSDFRVEHPEAVDKLLTQSIAVLLNAEMVTLERVAQDGTRVRANAGTTSFRRHKSLKKCLRDAEEQVAWVQREGDKPDGQKTARERAAQERAARERLERVERALRRIPEVEARRDRKSKEARVSTTDPQASVMKMGDGGYRPAYNVQFATDAAGAAVVGVTVSTSPADAHQMSPMLKDIERRSGRKPREYLVDGGYTDFKSVEEADAAGVTVYGPVPSGGDPAKRRDPLVPTKQDSQAIAEFRLRMASQQGQTTYKQRAQVAELTNAEAKDKRGLARLLVRGLGKVTTIAIWTALAVNLARLHSAGWI